MNIQNKTILITGANRGIGRALVTEALRRGAKRVYAGTRSGELQNADSRVTPLTLDVTNTAQIQAAVEKVESLDILINNAGLALYDDLSDRAALEQSLAINLYGPYGVTQAFLPLLTGSRGAIISVLSLSSIAAVPFSPAYSISKAAAFSLSQSLRALLAGRGVKVHVVLPGPVDTDMTRDLDISKLRSPSREPSSREWRKGRRTSSLIRCQRLSLTAGAAVQLSCLSASSRPSCRNAGECCVSDSALPSAKLVKGAKLKIVPGGPHGMCSTLKDQINAELLAFFHHAERKEERGKGTKVHMTRKHRTSCHPSTARQ